MDPESTRSAGNLTPMYRLVFRGTLEQISLRSTAPELQGGGTSSHLLHL